MTINAIYYKYLRGNNECDLLDRLYFGILKMSEMVEWRKQRLIGHSDQFYWYGIQFSSSWSSRNFINTKWHIGVSTVVDIYFCTNDENDQPKETL